MYRELSSHLRRPEFYERTADRFWDDPHIASRMLAAHLDPTTDAASRRPEFMDRSAAWIASLVPSGAALLDLGCGPGLYGRRFSDLGLQVTGVDLSASSIAYARAHDLSGDYRVLNYLALDVEAAFDIATLIWCDYGALTTDERLELLPRVARALKPGGLFVLDVFTPRYLAEITEGTSWHHHEEGGFFSPRRHLEFALTARYGDRVGLHRHVIVEPEGVRELNIWDTCFTRQELVDEVAPWFSEVESFDDVIGAPFTGEAETICCVLRS